MRPYKILIICSIAMWAVPLIIATIIFPVRNNDRILFESIMPVIVALAAVGCSVFYFHHTAGNFLKEGIILGIFAMVLCICMDLLLFMWGPMKMSFIEYMKDIGLTYLIIPIITSGTGKILKEKIFKLQSNN